MQPEQKDLAYIWDISEACKDIEQFVLNIRFVDFAANKLIRFAVERQIMVIGEAANHLSDSFKAGNSDIPWNKIIGMRNILAHDYGEVLAQRVWVTAVDFVPELYKAIRKYI
jgi:uncharacterized protein with HEPN domain